VTKQTDGLRRIIEQAMTQMVNVSEWQKRFMLSLFGTVVLIQGKINFANLSRHSELNEKTYRRWFGKDFNFLEFNLACIDQRAERGELVAIMDASYIAKSGTKTFGLGKFYSGCLGKAVKGLELSEIALLDTKSRQAFALDSQQTIDEQGKTRPELYANQFSKLANALPKELKYLLVDAYYSKKSFIDPICSLDRGIEIVGKLRCDANLLYLYRGDYQGMGRPKRYDGKVDFKDLSRFVYEGEVETHLHLYTQTVWHLHLKRTIRLVLLLNTELAKPRYILLFSTDPELEGKELMELYQLRFQIEFLFRDAKQFTGLADCQARNEKTLDFHFNMAMSAVNLAKLDLLQQHDPKQSFVFSLRSYIHRNFSQKLLNRLLSNLDLDLTSIKVNNAFNQALSFGLDSS
jgi:hypothetical protein